MSIRTILLHAAPDSGFGDRLSFAVALARQAGAHLKAVYTLYPAGVPRVGRALSIYVNELVHEAKEKEAGLKAQFETATEAAGVKGSWQTVEGEVTSALRDEVTFADVTVVSETPYGTVDDQLAATLPEHLALACNGPVVVVPTGKPVPARIGRVLVAWKPSREAGHAVRFALPVLTVADEVEVLTVEEGTPGIADSGARLAAYLTTHGVNAKHHHAAGGHASSIIANEAQKFGADLLVMGIYSRSRLAEMILGGVTASLLVDPPVPLFAAH
ncbi:universal stress protein [Ancylobacter dichloromethanicus]|uniref:Universal stress protein A n=1 Tax=Ancylobacter dichloromethanicus TaxID=518825 RepID=A0A9W6J5F4_9HYPH|nr:universal stress protein [Ancylobacter dichloromethanicus]MBS7554033.1 universal stress protein [Ancylobacter dichloromethanicus]GLK71146.1 universal stress protein A [Ancylobacter dichloromethanicus]